MDQEGDFEGSQGVGEAVETVVAGGVLESKAVLTKQGGLEGEALGVGAGEGVLGVGQSVEAGISHVAERDTRGRIQYRLVRKIWNNHGGTACEGSRLGRCYPKCYRTGPTFITGSRKRRMFD
jgi:hypothetical protein